MNYLLEIVIFDVVVLTICGINMKKKGKQASARKGRCFLLP